MSALGAVGEGLVELALEVGSDDVSLGYGGDAANVSVMAARLGVEARLAGRVGSDPFGDRLAAFWRRTGVRLTALRQDPHAATGMYVNETEASGGHRFSYWRAGSAGSRLGPDDLDETFFDDLGMLVVTGVTIAVSRTSAQAARCAIEQARERGARVACVVNHRPALAGDIGELAEVAGMSDILLASREEASTVFGATDAAELLALLAPGPTELVMTEGADPAVVVCPDGGARQAIPRVRVRNAGGAGDALAGAYLASRLRGRAPAQSLAWGVAAAALSVQRGGCAASYPSLEATAAMMLRLPPPQPLEVTA